MKSTETTAAIGRAAALDILRSAEGDELERVMDLGLPDSVFSALVANGKVPAPKSRPAFVCDRRTPAELGLSGLRPKIFLSGELSDTGASAAVAAGLFGMARSIYLGTVNGADVADLDAWIFAGLPVDVREVSSKFLQAYRHDRSMLIVDSAEAPAALCSFTALRRLVLTDG